MILIAWRLFKSLARYHHVMIIITILVPFIWSVLIPFWEPNGLVRQIIIYSAAILGLWLLAQVSVAFALRRDKSKAEQFVTHEVDTVSDSLSTLSAQHGVLIEEHGNSIDQLRRQIDDQYQFFRSAFEELGVDLPAREFSGHAEPIGFNITLSTPTATTAGGSKWARLRRSFRRFGYCLKTTVWGKPSHH